MSDSQPVNGRQFIRQARRWANANGQELAVEASRGRGGHQIVRIGGRWTTVKTGEIGTGLLAAMLKQLGIPGNEF